MMVSHPMLSHGIYWLAILLNNQLPGIKKTGGKLNPPANSFLLPRLGSIYISPFLKRTPQSVYFFYQSSLKLVKDS